MRDGERRGDPRYFAGFSGLLAFILGNGPHRSGDDSTNDRARHASGCLLGFRRQVFRGQSFFGHGNFLVKGSLGGGGTFSSDKGECVTSTLGCFGPRRDGNGSLATLFAASSLNALKNRQAKIA